MNKVNTATVTQCQAISVGQIILDDSNYLTFWGHLKTQDGWRRCDFVTSYDVLNEMLRHACHKNDAVQMTIVQKLEDMHQIPEIIDLEASLGAEAVFEHMLFRLSRPRYKQRGNWVEYTDAECYYIEKVTPLALPAKETAATDVAPTAPAAAPAAAPETATARYQQQISQCMDVLRKSYELYLGYLELDFKEDDARQQAGLGDDLKYTMAYCAWKQQVL